MTKIKGLKRIIEQINPSRLETKGAWVVFHVSGQNDTFKIVSPEGADVFGYYKDADFPGERSKKDRGEVFLTSVPERARLRGLGYSLTKDAVEVIKVNGCTEVNFSTTSDGGRRIVQKLIEDEIVSEPIKVSETGKTSHRIL